MKALVRFRKLHSSVKFLLVAWLAALVLLPSALAQSAPINLSFDKAAVSEGVWEGTVSGDISGDLRTVATFIDNSAPVWKVEFDFIVEAGDKSMVIHLKGTLNTNTGQVVMNGVVSDGYLQGAQVHEEGQLVDPETSRFQGSIRIMPRSAKRQVYGLEQG